MRKLHRGQSRLAVLMLGLALSAPLAAAGKDFSGRAAPDFEIPEMSFGTETALSDFDGRVVMLEFWFLG
jgi:hypothetical protein